MLLSYLYCGQLHQLDDNARKVVSHAVHVVEVVRHVKHAYEHFWHYSIPLS